MSFRQGDTYEPGRLEKRLGRGGNGEVWQVVTQSGDRVAAKFLTRGGKEARARFRREISVQRGDLSGLPGLLPVLDASGDEAEILWLTMPVAEPLESALDGDASVERVLAAMAEIARILAELGRRGYAHRDIKPGNLYRYQGAWTVGDLGLISLPEPEGVTLSGRALGPRHFLAPEMLLAGDEADGLAADVYSLAKTLWVLLTGTATPPPGTHSLSVQQLRVSEWISHPSGHRLDSLLERATAHEPSMRPQMAEMAEELELLASGPQSCASLERPNLAELGREIRAAAATNNAKRDQHQRRLAAARDLLAELTMACSGVVDVLNEVGMSEQSHLSHNDTVLNRCNTWVLPDLEWSQGACALCTLDYETGLVAANGLGRVYLYAGCGVLSCANGEAVAMAGLVLASITDTAGAILWTDSRRVFPGSAVASEAVRTLGEELVQRTPMALEAFVDLWKRQQR